MFRISGKSVQEPLRALTGKEQVLAESLDKDVRILADEIGERNMMTPGSMDKTAAWIEEQLSNSGYNPAREEYNIEGDFLSGTSPVAHNIVAEIKGATNPEKFLIIGAHYDSVSFSPGANDNASAVATLLAIAREFNQHQPSRSIRFVFFANEEPPFFHTPDMGSYAHAANCRNRNEEITGMIALDGLGYYCSKPGSQRYPAPGIGLIYPDTANFISFVTRVKDSSLLAATLRAFRKNATIPSEGAALPGFIPGVYWSDHWSFWKHNYPALLVTDTLLFRDECYHTSADTPERLDYPAMARVANGLMHTVQELAM